MRGLKGLKAAHLFARHLLPKLLGEMLAKAVIERDVVLALLIVGLEAGWHVMAQCRRASPVSSTSTRRLGPARSKRQPTS